MAGFGSNGVEIEGFAAVELADWTLRQSRPIDLVANKCDVRRNSSSEVYFQVKFTWNKISTDAICPQAACYFCSGLLTDCLLELSRIRKFRECMKNDLTAEET
jgi:hypothetical protein